MAGGGKSSGGDYWPGFVDALTNVVIAMVFVIVVLAIAMSYSAQKAAKKMAAKIIEQQEQAGLAKVAVPDIAPPAPTVALKPGVAAGTVPGAAPESKAAPSTQAAPAADAGPTVDAGIPVKTTIPVKGKEADPPKPAEPNAPQPVNIKRAERFLQLEYEATALTLDDEAIKKLESGVKPMLDALKANPSAKLTLVAVGPEMFLSESQRAAYVRVMSVRNQLLTWGVAPGRILTRIDKDARAPKSAVALRLENKP